MAPIGRPASCGLRGACAPRAHPGPNGSGILPSARPPHPHETCGGVRRPRELVWRGEKGVKKGLPPPAPASARPFRRRPWPARGPSAPPPPDRPRCHAASARPGPGAVSRVPPRRVGPPVPPSAARSPGPGLPSGGVAARGPRPGSAAGASRPGPRPPAPLRRGPPAAGLSRHVSLIFHVFTVPEIPYFTGFSARQAR